MPKVIEDLEFRLSEEARRQVERSGCAAYCSSFTVAAWVDTWPTVRSESSSYKKNMTGEIKDGKTVFFGAKCAIWLSCACLYVTQVTPVFYRLANGTGTGTASYIGAVIMLCGMGCMSWYRKNRFDNSLKANWTAQLINTAAQGALLLGILLL